MGNVGDCGYRGALSAKGAVDHGRRDKSASHPERATEIKSALAADRASALALTLTPGSLALDGRRDDVGHPWRADG
jgi:hypothetical protein